MINLRLPQGFTSKPLLNLSQTDHHITQIERTADYYLLTPHYYLLYGRHGALMIEHKGQSAIFSLHPNIRNRLTAFPPSSLDEALIIKKVLASNEKLGQIQVVRCSEGTIAIFDSLHLNYSYIENEVLDWKFPTALISTQLVSESKGRRFRRLRHDVNRIDSSQVSIEPMTAQHRFGLLSLVEKWAKRNVSSSFDFNNLTNPYHYLIDQVLAGSPGIKGFCVFQKGYLCSFNILAQVKEKRNIMSSLAFISDIDVKGISGYTRKEISKILVNQGVEYLFLGGAETKGLYEFKRKQRPIEEVLLQSAFLVS